MTDLDLLYTDVEEDLRASVRDLLARRSTVASVLATYDGDRSGVAPLWQVLAVDLGLAGLLVPEDRGGVGGSAREAAVVLEELGRSMAPVPFLTSAVVATTVLLTADVGGPADDLLHRLAAGDAVAALAVPLGAFAEDLRAPASVDEAGRVTGRILGVAGALEADVLLVPVDSSAGVAVHAVDVGDAAIEPITSLDMSRQLSDITLEGAAARLLLPAHIGAVGVRCGLRVGSALLASEQLGIAQWCLSETVAYLKNRRQFNRVVGSFQAVKHRLADLYLAVETASAAARFAAAALAADHRDTRIATAVAQSWCSDVAVRAAEEAVQLHGGLGMTWEHPAHLYLKRAKADQVSFGSPGRHRALLADVVGLPAPSPSQEAHPC